MAALPNMNQCFEMLHEAALDHTLWRQALENLSRAVGAEGALVLQLPTADRDMRSPSLDDSMNFYYKHSLYKADIRVARGMPISLRNGIVVDQDFISEDEVRKNPYYQDFMRRFGGRWFAGITTRIGGAVLALSIQRNDAQGPFVKAEQKNLMLLRGKFHDACVIANAVSRARASGYLDGLELFHQPAALVNPSGQVMAMNDALRNTLSPGLNVRNNRFICANPMAEKALEEAIKVATTFDPRRLNTIGRATIPFGEERALLVTAVPYPSSHTFFLGSARAVVLFQNSTVRRSPSMAALMSMFNLTLSEARLTAALVRTTDLQTAAKECGLTFGSARQYMTSIFEKTATSGQVDLVAIVSAGPFRI